jgi:outer membrane receptor protein involved in Fe transport
MILGGLTFPKSAGGCCVRTRAFLQALVVLALTAGSAAVAEAQQQQNGRVTGTVIDSVSGAPLSAVQVYLEGSSLGTMSRQNGQFSIGNIPPGRYQLRAERIGLTLALREITVGAGETVQVNFALVQKALGLDQIVVTGTAGAARRREVGNTISQINVGDIPERPVDVTDIIQAKAPGVEVTVGGGGAGQGSKIRLRGSKSLEMGSDPIIYIDGIRMMGGAFPVQAAKDQGNRAANVTQSPLDMLNPNDIERIEVIKGSAATTLYGTEASAGVIQVFTKRGSQGAPVWTFETQQGTQWSQRFGAGSAKYMYMDPWICTGFLKCGEFQDKAHTQMYAASVRGGGQNLQYYSSGELMDEHGNTPNDDIEKWTARGNFTYTPMSSLQLQWNTAYVNHHQNNTAQGNNAEGLELNVFRQNQNYFTDNDTALINQVLGQTLESTIERFTTGGTATYSPLQNMTNRLTIGYDFNNQETRNIRPFGFFAHPEGIIHVSNYQRRILTFDYVGSFAFDLLSSLRSTFSWGGQATGDELRQVEGYGRGFPGAAEPTVSSAATALGYESRQKVWNAGFFLQNLFSVSDKYFLTLGMRVDGNSAFGSGFGLQVYPKASASWVVSDESFWNDSWGELKLRTAYGQSGRAPGAFDAVRTWTNTSLAGEAAFTPVNVGNADLGPEVTGEFEAGFDAAWFDERIRSTFTYYRAVTNDALLNYQQIPSLGFTNSQLTNVGKIENKGVELSLEVSPIRRPNFGWDLGVNVSTNYSEVLEHLDPDDEGRPILYSLHTLIRNPDAVPTYTTSANGNVTYSLPVCNDATPAEDPCRMTSQFRGPNLPTEIISGFTSVRLPLGISVSARGEYRGGHYTTGINPIAIGRSVRSPVCEPHYANTENVQLKPETPALWVARCTPSLNGVGYSAKADYFKLRSVSATLPVDFAFPDRIQNATLTLALDNLYTWSRESLFGTFGIENFSNAGIAIDQTGISSNERIPAPTSFRASLRVTF